MKPLQIIAFIVIAVLDLYMVINDLPRVWTKPLLMLSLVVFSLFQLRQKSKDHLLFLTAQCFALFGDISLLGNGSLSFILGLGSFLIMQLLYAFVFFKQKAIGVHKRRLAIGLIIVIGLVFFKILLPYTGHLMLPVILYNISILGMVIMALLRWKVSGYWLVVIGAILFLISDATLGYAKFVGPILHSGFIIMFTYSAAQLCIVHGYLKPLNTEK